MYLKHLELQGYKSFARKTEFVFDRGITAIVGPNGSGKSNIADAVRWVLGETRMSRLRAKTTDDLIFAGSDGRARLGMAQVTLTLDNSDGGLPIDYTEVTIQRRAYRDGQNEYLLNGTKVRRRDIVELLGASGLTRDAYTVIGQGLVDTALSLRPQERRALIDVAAGIRPLQEKRDRALAQLEETRENLTRVRDIAAELEPRLRRLEKQAERARQGAQIAAELAEALKTWYGYQWHIGQQALRDARARAAATRQALEQHRQAVQALERRLESRREQEEAQANALQRLRNQRAELRSRYETVRRELAVQQERTSFLQRRHQELTQEIADLQARRAEQHRQLTQTEAALIQLSEQCERLTAQVTAMRQTQAGVQQRRAAHQSALADARQQAYELATVLSDIRSRLATLAERRAALTRERAAQQDALIELAAQVDERQAALDATHRQIESHAQAVQELQRSRTTAQVALEEATSHLDALTEKVHTARRRLERLQTRRDTLAEMRKAGPGDAAGAQALLRARDELGGILGSVASLIRVPAKYETAIEAALGPALHAIVVETWDDARRAIAWLQANQAGRATLLVSQEEELGGGAANSAEDGGVGNSTYILREGSIGVAAELVTCEPAHKALVQRLLGQIVVAEDLNAVQHIASDPSRAPSRSLIFVTLDGTVIHPAGHITGGTIQAHVLRQERLWRELPTQIQAAEAEVRHLEEEQAQAQATVNTLTHRLADIDARIREAERARAETQAAAERAQRDVETLEREMGWRQSVLDQRTAELKAVQRQIGELEGRLASARQRHAETLQQVESLQAELEALEADVLRGELAEAEKQLALAQQEQQNQQAKRAELKAALAGIDRQIEGKRSQTQTLTAEIEVLRTRITDTANAERQLAEELSALTAEITPIEEALGNMREAGRDLERRIAHARNQLHQAELAVSEAGLEVQRCEDRLIALRDKIADDLELAVVGEGLPQQLKLALGDEAEELPIVTEVPEGLERRVRQLRRQMRQLGTTSPEIIAEYEETKKRYDFLTSQATDLEEAADDLRAIADELTRRMTERFTATFDEVARAFERYFKQLFGGGEAHLSLRTDEGDTEPGLEIVARPPGKRSQSLALLSGGERALTAVALLLSLLQVSPTPFCVLDEVDAMLDEVNIGRFRSAVEGLAQETQFIIITHNRGTIQAANTVYGISMGDEGVSQALSLKLEELEPAAA